MENQWVGKNIDLILLSELIEDFFRGKEFKIRKLKSADGCKILVFPQQARKKSGMIEMTIRGDPNDFVISFTTMLGSSPFRKFGSILTLLGGGAFLLQSLKLQEALEKLEREFWMYMQEAIASGTS